MNADITDSQAVYTSLIVHLLLVLPKQKSNALFTILSFGLVETHTFEHCDSVLQTNTWEQTFQPQFTQSFTKAPVMW